MPASGLFFLNTFIPIVPSFALPNPVADAPRNLGSEGSQRIGTGSLADPLVDGSDLARTPDTDRYRPITIFNLEDVAERFPRLSNVFI